MAGSRRQKLKKKAGGIIDAFSPSQSPVSADSPDDGLLDDLLAQLNQPNGQPNPETGKVLLDIADKPTEKSSESLSSKLRKDPRTRWKERQVRLLLGRIGSVELITIVVCCCKARKAAALAANQSPDDPAAAAQIEREKQEEGRAIKAVCDDLGLEMWEVGDSLVFSFPITGILTSIIGA